MPTNNERIAKFYDTINKMQKEINELKKSVREKDRLTELISSIYKTAHITRELLDSVIFAIEGEK